MVNENMCRVEFNYGSISLNLDEKLRLRKIIDFFNSNSNRKKISILRLSKEIKEPYSTLNFFVHKLNGHNYIINNNKRFNRFFYLNQISKRYDRKILKPQTYIVSTIKR